MEYRVFGASNVGKVRENNEDAFFLTETEGLFAVADGMGGRKAGEVAAGLAIETIKASLLKMGENVEQGLKEAVLSTNESVRKNADSKPDNKGMGCTCVVMVLKNENFFVAHVGDSRVYLFRKGELKQITRDHSYVEELFIKGLITEEEKVNHPYRNQITRYIGSSSKLDVDITSGSISNGDVFLLCTDGLSEEVQESSIEGTISSHQEEPEKIVTELIAKALENGGRDNTTAVVVSVKTKKISFFKKFLGW